MELSRTFAWEGRRIAWDTRGDGPAVVFCHGTPWSSATWAPVADALATEYAVHLWDLPGYGRSSKDPAHDVHAGVHARALAALLDHWGLERPHVVAHDLGGLVALRAHLVEGAAYASLFLADVVAIGPSGSPFFRFVQEHRGVLAGLPAYVHEAVVRAYVGDALHRDLGSETLDALVAPWLGAEGQAAFYRQIEDYDVDLIEADERALPTLDLPVRIVWGTDDGWIPLATGRRLAALVPGAELTEIPGAGHLVQLEAPGEVLTALSAWLARGA
ncbi:alpha/beta fold hydrolase [Nocardioides anomalus]|uniref:Alpha/beta fold hydrolase n=1 Tax=Nocardioides anomalus TaxID=2712223 RepID=A0A6G6WJM1_9ACTN|nr:alpha/beta fold hydrolase [Nocardioides anomalus]QIG45412.1 alpha/beta fold hydrolase [Nocardioides anomalus]